MFFNELGYLDLDELVAKQPSYQVIMEDGKVTDDELAKQTKKVVDLMREAERRFSDEDQRFIKCLLAESNVLSAVYNFYELQNLKENGNV